MAENMLALSRRIAVDALQSVNREAQGAVQDDPGGAWRWNFGIYLFSEDESLRRDVPADENGGTPTRAPQTSSAAGDFCFSPRF